MNHAKNRRRRDPGRKFIIIQMDGLGYTLLQRLLYTRYMPFLRWLCNRYYVEPYDPGYPTTTPFVQAGILYGDNSNVPGFRFYDKKTRFHFTMGLASGARRLEEELARNQRGILEGGTSIGTIFTGGAKRSVLTVAQVFQTERGQHGAVDISLFILKHPLASFRVAVFSIYEFLVELYESLLDIVSSFVNGRHFNWPFFYPYFPFFRAFINATAKEIETQSALTSMKRGVPSVFITYGGYDWISHYRGPESLSAFSLLRDIDSSVRKLYKRARKEGYDVYVFSDHGHIPAVPFDRLYYESFEQFVERIARMPAQRLQVRDEEESHRFKFLSYKLRRYYANFSLPVRASGSWLIATIGAPLRRKRPSDEPRNGKQILISYSSSLAQLYFSYVPHRLSLSEINARHPYLVSQIVHHPGIGFVIAKEDDAIHILHKAGTVVIHPDSVDYHGEHFLRQYGDQEKLVGQIRDFAHLTYSGDLIINGAFNGKRIVAFEDFHLGSHDSIGGKQNDAFFISKEKFDLSHVRNAKELHSIFTRYSQQDGISDGA